MQFQNPLAFSNPYLHVCLLQIQFLFQNLNKIPFSWNGTKTKNGSVTLPGSNSVSVATGSQTWPRHSITEDVSGVDKNSVEARALFEFVDSDSTGAQTPLAYHVYKTLFFGDKDGEGIMINPMSILRIRVEKAEVPENAIRFKSKSLLQSIK